MSNYLSVITANINNLSLAKSSIGLKISGKGVYDNSNINYDNNGIGFQLTSNANNYKEFAIINTSNHNNTSLRIGISEPAIYMNTNNKPLIINSNFTIINGNIGIGITNPQHALNIKGNILLSGNFNNNIFSQWNNINSNIYYNQGNIGIGIIVPQSLLHLSSAQSLINITDSIIIGKDSNQNGLLWNNNNTNLFFGTSNKEQFRITSNGNVGIGTITPLSNIDINGNIILSGDIDNSIFNNANLWTYGTFNSINLYAIINSNSAITLTQTSIIKINYGSDNTVNAGTYDIIFANGAITFSGLTSDYSYPILKDANGNNNPNLWCKFDTGLITTNDGSDAITLINNNSATNANVYVKGNNSINLNGTNQFLSGTIANIAGSSWSISAWIYSRTTLPQTGAIVSFGSVAYNYECISVGYNMSSSGCYAHNDYNNEAISDPFPDDINTWVHVVFMYDASTRTRYIYRNGVKLILSLSIANGQTNPNTNIIIGKLGTSGNTYYFNGYIDDLRIYRGLILTDAQITELYKGRVEIYEYGGRNIYYNKDNVGIGTTSPQSLLQLSSLQSLITINDNLTYGKNSNQSGLIWNSNNFNIILGTFNQEKMRISSNGNIGIGTNNPQKLLDIRNNININGNLIISNVNKINSNIFFYSNQELNISKYNVSNYNLPITTCNINNIISTNYSYILITSNTTIQINNPVFSDLLLVGAGGNGGLGAFSGGGGAGEVIYYPDYLFKVGIYKFQPGLSIISAQNSIKITTISYNNNDIIKSNGGCDGNYIYFTVFNYTGTIQIFNIPSGVSSINIYCWGAGGGNTFLTSGIFIGAKGGNGGFVKATFTIPQNITSLAIIVGQGGRKGLSNSTSGNAFGGGGTGSSGNQDWQIGGGGGFSGVFINNANMTIVNSYQVNTNATPIIISGAGGGGGGVDSAFSTTFNYGGNGGGNIANDSSGARIGGGGGQSSGGTGTYVGNKYAGANTINFSAGGGAGWYGGGAISELTGVVGGGGGGSSYVNTNDYTITNITNIKTTNNSSAVVPGNTESYYSTGIGAGAAAATSTSSLANGGNGLVILEYILSTTQTSNIGSGGGGYLNNSGTPAGIPNNENFSLITTGNAGSATKGGDGGSALPTGRFITTITGSPLSVGLGGAGATATSTAVNGINYGDGGSGNGGLGAPGVIIMRFPRTASKYLTITNNFTEMSNLQISGNIYTSNFMIIDNNWIKSANNIYYNQGNIGIGLLRPSFKLDIINDINVVGNYYRNGTILSYSGSGTVIYSDNRIKTNIIDINDDSALQQILKIEPKIYNYIDINERGTDTVYGFIAQQIREVIPQAVKIQKDFIPNIYKYYDCINYNQIITNEDLTAILKIGDRIKIKDNHQDFYRTATIITITETKITVDLTIHGDKCFIYGKEINDFHYLDKNYIYTLGVCATQDLYKILNRLNDKYNEQQMKITKLLQQ